MCLSVSFLLFEKQQIKHPRMEISDEWWWNEQCTNWLLSSIYLMKQANEYTFISRSFFQSTNRNSVKMSLKKFLLKMSLLKMSHSATCHAAIRFQYQKKIPFRTFLIKGHFFDRKFFDGTFSHTSRMLQLGIAFSRLHNKSWQFLLSIGSVGEVAWIMNDEVLVVVYTNHVNIILLKFRSKFSSFQTLRSRVNTESYSSRTCEEQTKPRKANERPVPA